MNNEQFDRMFEASFEASSAGILPETSASVPDYGPSWQRVQHRLKAERRRSGIRSRLTKLAIIAASLTLGAAIFGNNHGAKAIAPIYATIKEYPSGVYGFFFNRRDSVDTSKAKTAPPPGYDPNDQSGSYPNPDFHSDKVTLEESREQLSFPVPKFGYIPADYELSDVYLDYYVKDAKADSADYVFANKSGNLLHVTLYKLKENEGIGVPQSKEGVSSRVLTLNGTQAVLITSTDGTSQIRAVVLNNIFLTIGGRIPEDEVIKAFEKLY
jgi:hypothetical protein